MLLPPLLIMGSAQQPSMLWLFAIHTKLRLVLTSLTSLGTLSLSGRLCNNLPTFGAFNGAVEFCVMPLAEALRNLRFSTDSAWSTITRIVFFTFGAPSSKTRYCTSAKGALFGFFYSTRLRNISSFVVVFTAKTLASLRTTTYRTLNDFFFPFFVKASMVCLTLKKQKILDSVIRFVSVYVMNNFTYGKCPTNRLGHLKTMRKNPSVLHCVWVGWFPNQYVSTPGFSHPRRMFF